MSKAIPEIPVSRSERVFLLVLSVVIGALFIVAAMVLVPDVLPEIGRGASIAVSVGVGVVTGGGFAGAATWWWKYQGGPVMQSSVQDALRVQQLPATADVRLWSVLLDRQEGSIRRTRYYVAAIILLVAVMVFFAVTAADAELRSGLWVGSVMGVALAIYGPWEARKRKAVVRILRDELDQRSDDR